MRRLLIAALPLIAVLAALATPRREPPARVLTPALAIGTAVDRPAPGASLLDSQGRGVSLRSFRGRWVVLAPSATLCHEVCPVTTAVLGELSARLPSTGNVVLAEVSVDPWRDTPARLRAYARLTGTRLALLTGDRARLRAFWRFFGVAYRRGAQGNPPDVDWLTHRPERFDVQHTDGVFIIDPAGHERVVIAGPPVAARPLPSPLRRLLSGPVTRAAGAWSASAVLADLRALGGVAAPLPRVAGSGIASGGLAAALRRLRGRPIVVNAWASWCAPCRQEFPLLASSERRFGSIAFLGADTNDSADAAQAFLAHHPVAYPSLASSPAQLGQLAPIVGLPTTIFVAPSGRVAHVHAGQYTSQRQLDADIARYAAGA